MTPEQLHDRLQELPLTQYFNCTLNRWFVKLPDGSRMYRYRWIMEQHLGRKLSSGEHVHHRNGDPTDDRLENLEVLVARDHHGLHGRLYSEAAKNNPWATNYEACQGCGTTELSHAGKGFCTRCRSLQLARARGVKPAPVRRMETVPCPWCATPFERPARPTTPKFCSKRCASRHAMKIRWHGTAA